MMSCPLPLLRRVQVQVIVVVVVLPLVLLLVHDFIDIHAMTPPLLLVSADTISAPSPPSPPPPPPPAMIQWWSQDADFHARLERVRRRYDLHRRSHWFSGRKHADSEAGSESESESEASGFHVYLGSDPYSVRLSRTVYADIPLDQYPRAFYAQHLNATLVESDPVRFRFVDPPSGGQGGQGGGATPCTVGSESDTSYSTTSGASYSTTPDAGLPYLWWLRSRPTSRASSRAFTTPPPPPPPAPPRRSVSADGTRLRIVFQTFFLKTPPYFPHWALTIGDREVHVQSDLVNSRIWGRTREAGILISKPFHQSLAKLQRRSTRENSSRRNNNNNELDSDDSGGRLESA